MNLVALDARDDRFSGLFGARRGDGARTRPLEYDLAAPNGLEELLAQLRERRDTASARNDARRLLSHRVAAEYQQHRRFKAAVSLALAPSPGNRIELFDKLYAAADHHTGLLIRDDQFAGAARSYHSVIDAVAIAYYVQLLKSVDLTDRPYTFLLDDENTRTMRERYIQPRDLLTAENLHGYLELNLNLAVPEARANINHQMRRALN